MSGSTRRRTGNKQARRAKLQRDLEQSPAPRLPDGPPENDPATPLAIAAVQAGDDRKAQHITALRVSHLTSATNYFVNMQGSSRAQIDAIVKNVEVEMMERFSLTGNRQGKSSSGWVCLDYDSIVVNVFSPEEREFYGIEKFWSAGQQLDLSDLVSPPASAGEAEFENSWTLDGDDDDDDWSLGSDDWALGGEDDWIISGFSGVNEGEEQGLLTDQQLDEWSLDESDADAWEMSAEEWTSPGARLNGAGDEDADSEDGLGGTEPAGGLAGERDDMDNGADPEVDDGVEEEDWALGDDKLRVRSASIALALQYIAACRSSNRVSRVREPCGQPASPAFPPADSLLVF
eukprot:scaffold294377_cov27-Tisochrysis_lutea.AAC.1